MVVSDLLEDSGYERYEMKYYTWAFRRTVKMFYIYRSYILSRLKHMSGDKYNYRGGSGKRTMLTKQPTSGEQMVVNLN